MPAPDADAAADGGGEDDPALCGVLTDIRGLESAEKESEVPPGESVASRLEPGEEDAAELEAEARERGVGWE